MEFQEKFIDKNIAELCKTYDMIKGANTNIARITPDYIDGLKPVQRRALYIMYLKDQGKTFRKLATISGDTFGRVHPHCLHPDVEFFLTNGDRRRIADLYEDPQETFDILSYDEKTGEVVKSTMGHIRITKYVDEFYEICLSTGTAIRCTEDHRILTLRDDVPTWVRADEMKVGDILFSGDIFGVSFEGEENPVFNVDTNVKVNNTPLVVEMIEVVPYDHVPMYDYTVDGYGNGSLYIASYTETSHVFAIVKNSPVAIEDAIVGIEQPWRNSIPLIEGEGNFGTVSGDVAGASRYIKARLSDYARACFFDDWKDSVVDMELAYDEETMMPLYLPAKYPNVLLNGCLGIGLTYLPLLS